MTDLEELEMRNARLEAALGRANVNLARAQKRIADLVRMTKNDQKYIGSLQAQIKRNTGAVDSVFGGGE